MPGKHKQAGALTCPTAAVYGLRMMTIRDAEEQSDAAACAAIYGPYVSDSVVPFEAQPPTIEEMAGRISAAHAWVLAEHKQSHSAMRTDRGTGSGPRTARRRTSPSTLTPATTGQASGRALYARLFDELRAIGLWTLCAGITQPNDASNGLHHAIGLVPVGTYRRIGWKAGPPARRPESSSDWTSARASQAHPTARPEDHLSAPASVIPAVSATCRLDARGFRRSRVMPPPRAVARR